MFRLPVALQVPAAAADSGSTTQISSASDRATMGRQSVPHVVLLRGSTRPLILGEAWSANGFIVVDPRETRAHLLQDVHLIGRLGVKSKTARSVGKRTTLYRLAYTTMPRLMLGS